MKETLGRFNDKFEDLPENQEFIKLLKEIGYDYKHNLVPYTSHSSFNHEPCSMCGATKLIRGMGRYCIFDFETGKAPVIYLCGYCENRLENDWKIKMEFV
jgi:hypothetical protein